MTARSHTRTAAKAKRRSRRRVFLLERRGRERAERGRRRPAVNW